MITMQEMIDKVNFLIGKAAASTNAIEALQYSQAAVNSANALSQIKINLLDKK